MLEKELSIYDIRAIGAGRYFRKFFKSGVVWLLVLMGIALLIGSCVIAIVGHTNFQYTLPSGEVVEKDGDTLVMVADGIVLEKDNPESPWSPALALVIVAIGMMLSPLIYEAIHEGRAKDKIMEEWLAAGYQPKATDV